MSTAKSLFICRESSVWGSLRSQKAALAEANERLAQRSPRWWTFGCSVMS
jgi:hypothetical protein